jgi:hypothetical protein
MKESLSARAKRFLEDLRKRQIWNKRASLVLVVTALALAVGAIVLGIYDHGTIAACFGIVVGGLVACDRAFGFGAVSDYLPAVIVEAEVLEERIEGARNERALARINAELNVLRRTVAQSAPLGIKMDAVEAFLEKYKSTNPLQNVLPHGKPKTVPKAKCGTKIKSKRTRQENSND